MKEMSSTKRMKILFWSVTSLAVIIAVVSAVNGSATGVLVWSGVAVMSGFTSALFVEKELNDD